MRISYLLLTLTLSAINHSLPAQDLMKILDSNKVRSTEYIHGTFKSTRIVIGQSIETPPDGNLIFLVTHHFGLLNSGYENLFGLNQAYIRLGLEYGITDWLALGLGLNTYKITWDGFVKARILRQSKGARRMPLSLNLFAGIAVKTNKWENSDRTNYFSSRISYVFQVQVSRKFGERLSLQLMPGLVHKNLVMTTLDHNDIFSLGAGGRIKVSKRVSINAEYHYVFPGQIRQKVYNSFSAGVDIETGGHVFQIFLTNSTGEIEEFFIPETEGSWWNGDIYLGFNISRIFTIVKPRLPSYSR